jgi:ArsR family transcriptional regulator
MGKLLLAMQTSLASNVMQIAKALGDAHRFAIYTQIARSDELFCGEMCAKHTISPARSPTT